MNKKLIMILALSTLMVLSGCESEDERELREFQDQICDEISVKWMATANEKRPPMCKLYKTLKVCCRTMDCNFAFTEEWKSYCCECNNTVVPKNHATEINETYKNYRTFNLTLN